MAASSPSWASEITSLVPFRPRFASVLRNALQNVSASEGPMCSPTISCLRTDLRFAPPVGVHGHRDYGRHGDDAPALADLQIGGVEPQVGPLALQGAPQKGPDPLVDGEPWVAIGPRAMASAELGDGGLRDPAHAHRLDEVVDLARRDAGDPSLLDDGHQRLLDGLSRLQEPWEVGAGPELGDLEAQRPEPRLQRPVAGAVAPGRAVAGALVAPGADHALDVPPLRSDHDDLEHALGEAAEKVLVAALREQLGQRWSVVGHRDRPQGLGEAANSTLPDDPGDHRDRRRQRRSALLLRRHRRRHRNYTITVDATPVERHSVGTDERAMMQSAPVPCDGCSVALRRLACRMPHHATAFVGHPVGHRLAVAVVLCPCLIKGDDVGGSRRRSWPVPPDPLLRYHRVTLSGGLCPSP